MNYELKNLWLFQVFENSCFSTRQSPRKQFIVDYPHAPKAHLISTWSPFACSYRSLYADWSFLPWLSGKRFVSHFNRTSWLSSSCWRPWMDSQHVRSVSRPTSRILYTALLVVLTTVKVSDDRHRIRRIALESTTMLRTVLVSCSPATNVCTLLQYQRLADTSWYASCLSFNHSCFVTSSW